MEQAMEFIENLASQLGVAVEYLWTVLVKQQLAEGITTLAKVFLILIVLFLILRYAPKLTKKMIDKKHELAEDRLSLRDRHDYRYVPSDVEDFYGAMRFIIPIASAIFVIIMLSVSLDSIGTGIQKLINPDYFALKEILDAIKAG